MAAYTKSTKRVIIEVIEVMVGIILAVGIISEICALDSHHQQRRQECHDKGGSLLEGACFKTIELSK